MPTIKDNGEPLIDLKKFCPKLKFDLDQDRKKLEKTAYARKTVAEKLNQAITLLPTGLTFKLADAWRPQYIQDKYFRWYILFLTKKHPSWNNERVIMEVKKYVHPSKGKYSSGHLTGGALDISLCYLKNGKRLPLKSSILSFQENATSFQPKLPKHIQANRKTMFDALSGAGFINYPKEYWHWSYGDIRWAERVGKKLAVYGIKSVSLKK